MKLTKNFLLSELFKGEKPSPTQVQTATMFAVTVLQPIRDFVSHPLLITSGYRTPEHNKKIGGSPTSEHQWIGYTGAVDISIPDHLKRWDVFNKLYYEFHYGIGQCIWYTETTHLHISIASVNHQGEFLICSSKTKHKYHRFEDFEQLLEIDKRLRAFV